MKRISKIISVLILGIILTFSLASCNSDYDFYKDYASADISSDSDFKYEAVTTDVVKGLRDNKTKNGFVVILGTSSDSQCVSAIETIYSEAENVNYKGIVLYLSVTDIISSLSAQEETSEALGVKELTSANYGIVTVCYNADGSVKFDTSDPTKYEGVLTKLCAKSTNVKTGISTRALADYIFEYYPLKSIDDIKKN